jgi:hypothetical protein
LIKCATIAETTVVLPVPGGPYIRVNLPTNASLTAYIWVGEKFLGSPGTTISLGAVLFRGNRALAL